MHLLQSKDSVVTIKHNLKIFDNFVFMENPLIQIAILCNNHAAFVAGAIQSVLNQKTDFSFQIYIVDDGSTDNSADIIREYEQKHPDLIQAILLQQNSGVLEVAKLLDNVCHAKYACILDADDYWSYPEKLQLQIQFLENNPEYAGCFHDAEILSSVPVLGNALSVRSQNIHKTYSQFNAYKPDMFPADIVKRTIIPTASLVFRRKPLLHVLQQQTDYVSLFWVLQLEIIKSSKFRYFNECWSVYRDHPAGVSKTHNLMRFKKQHINVLIQLLHDPFYKYHKADIYESLASEYRSMIWSAEHEPDNKQPMPSLIRNYRHFSKLALKHRSSEFKKRFL